MKNGVMDIKNHKWFSGDWDWEELASRSIKPTFVPEVSSKADTSNFAEYPDSPKLADEVPEDLDPFLSW
jgi:hypothetical protein